MNVLEICLLIFIILELGNVSVLYFMPKSRVGNGTGIFKTWTEMDENNNEYLLASYLINWVAGTKLIFILVGTIVIIFADYQVQFYTVIVLILSILTFYFRLFPLIKTMDEKDLINPKGYSKILNIMILSFVIMFTLGAILSLILV